MRAAAWVSISLGFSLGLVAAACTSTLPQPMTAADVAELDSGEALVAYLRQPGASPAACDLQAKGPHVSRVDEDLATAFVGGLTDGQIDPALWRRCADGLFGGAPPEGKAALFGAVADGYRALIEDPTFETSPALQARLAAIQTGYIERPVNLPAPAPPGDPFDELRRTYFAGHLGPAAKRFAGELLAVVDLEHGRYGGRAVDLALLDDLGARGDATLLRRFADRLPSEPLRVEARRRVVRLAIAASPYPEVRANREEIETRVLATGVNRVSIAEQPATRATLDVKTISGGTVVVRQDVPYQRSTLVLADHGPGPSVLPELSLRGVLWVDVAGVSRPITLCAPAQALDPSPCLAPEDVKLENPLAYLDRGGAFHFVDHITGLQTVELARGATAFSLPISVGGRRLAALDWPLQFERPKDLLLSGAGRGPDLTVTVGRLKTARFTFAVTSDSATYQVVVDEADLGAFRIGSIGAPGRSGFDGSKGTDGSDGLSGSCLLYTSPSPRD